jgi:hypothetical protein
MSVLMSFRYNWSPVNSVFELEREVTNLQNANKVALVMSFLFYAPQAQ